MRSMRSVITNPPTMLLNDAATAIAPENRGEAGLMAAGDDDGRNHHDGVEGIGQRHERRVQQRGHPLDDFKSHEAGQDEDVQVRNEICWHDDSSAFVQCAFANAGILKNSRTRAFTTSPPLVIMVSRMISSC